jgi:murein L,D-transpeptidase YcbB/YkuD
VRAGFLIAICCGLVQLTCVMPACVALAEDSSDAQAAETPPAAETPASRAATSAAESPADEGAGEAEAPATPAPAHPMVALIREKLTEPDIRKDAADDGIAALETFYGTRSKAPLWITDMGFSARGQAALFEIEKADDWGLDAKAFALPDPNALPADEEAQALAEIKLDLAILKYARFARGGRHELEEISDLLDLTPPLRDPETVLAEIGSAEAPDAYLQSLHPRHEQFVRLRQALLKARDENGETKASETDIRRIIINMERWRWMPEDLGPFYVWLNTPEFMLYVVKDGKTIFKDKTLVGTIGFPTPVFSADMKRIVFNPDWIAPPSVLEEKLWPALRRKYYNILKSNKLLVSYKGKRVDPTRIDWNRVDIHNFTFTQKSGPKNVLGKAKFLYPNKHVVYLHDTLAYRKKVFKEDKRDIGYGCVRMEQPQRFAELLLAEDKEWPASKVKDLWDKGVNSSVTVDMEMPVHTTYFTAVVDEEGKVATFGDLYGLDRKHAIALFGDAKGFPQPPPEPKQRRTIASSPTRHTGEGSGVASSLGFISD